MAAASTTQRTAAQSDAPSSAAGRPFTYFIDAGNKSLLVRADEGDGIEVMAYLSELENVWWWLGSNLL